MKQRVFPVILALLLGLSGQVSALEVKKVKLPALPRGASYTDGETLRSL